MSLFTTLYTARSGLSAAQAGLSATAHNVANALTPGYNRRHVQQSITDPIRIGQVWIGTGTTVDGILRNAGSLLGMQRIAQSGPASAAATLASDLGMVEMWLDETRSNGIRLSLAEFFDTVTAASADPADPGLRSGVARAGSALASSISGTARAFEGAMSSNASHVMSGVADVNAQLIEIARLNSAIRSAGGSLAAGDLADQRDLAIRAVAEMAGVTVNLQPDGQATVFLGGHAVVSGGDARQLTVDTSGPGGPTVTLEVDGGSVNVNKSLGGQIGGHIDAYVATSSYLDDLNTFAAEFSATLNAQHAAGYDRTGAPGGDLFSFDPLNAAVTMSFSTAISLDPDQLAFASDPSALAGDGGNLMALLALEDQSIVGGKTAGTFLSNLTTRVGGDVASAALIAARQADIVFDLDELATHLSGVDMDEEATNLIIYQTAYAAAAKVMQVTDEMLATLLDLT